MALLTCPGCGKREQLDLHGRYLITCDCGKQFTAVILRAKPLPPTQVVCPNCGSSEEMPLPQQALQLTCTECGHQFILSPTSQDE